MTNLFEKIEKENNGMVEKDGRNYILTQVAYREDGHYEAMAVCKQDIPDEEGWVPGYRVTWEIREDYNPELQEEEDACNWDEAESVEEEGEYDLINMRNV